MGAELPSSPVVPITLEGLSCEVRGWGGSLLQWGGGGGKAGAGSTPPPCALEA